MKFRKTIKIPAESQLQKRIPTWQAESLFNGERHKVLELCSLEKTEDLIAKTSASASGRNCSD